MKAVVVLLALLACVAQAHWGFTVHGIVSQIAQSNLTSRAAAQVNALVGGDLESIATWADEIRSQSKYAWSAGLHYVNPLSSNYPSKCSISYPRDCPNENCVVGAIFNYTAQLIGSKPSPSKAEALKFLTHFAQDIHNPLHVFGPPDLVGGNNINVKFYGSSWNLHALWDSGISEKTIANLGSESRYVSEILSKANGKWHADILSAITCRSHLNTAICPDEWAVGVEQLNCATVMTGVFNGANLGDAYYNLNYEVAEKQIAIAGYRLAAVLNQIFV